LTDALREDEIIFNKRIEQLIVANLLPQRKKNRRWNFKNHKVLIS
jgi:hypothetical protein